MTAAAGDVHLRCAVGAEQYAIPVGSVLEVAPVGELTPVFGAPAGVLGIRNVRGRLVPVLDLAALMGVDPDAGPERIVVIDHRGTAAALAVGAVVDVGPLPAGAAGEGAGPLERGVLVDDRLVGILDLEALLSGFSAGSGPHVR